MRCNLLDSGGAPPKLKTKEGRRWHAVLGPLRIDGTCSKLRPCNLWLLGKTKMDMDVKLYTTKETTPAMKTVPEKVNN
jgi:hypothetical protein